MNEPQGLFSIILGYMMYEKKRNKNEKRAKEVTRHRIFIIFFVFVSGNNRIFNKQYRNDNNEWIHFNSNNYYYSRCILCLYQRCGNKMKIFTDEQADIVIKVLKEAIKGPTDDYTNDLLRDAVIIIKNYMIGNYEDIGTMPPISTKKATLKINKISKGELK